MKFKYVHNNINVLDLEKSVTFYKEALGLREASRKEGDGFILAFLTDEDGIHEIELTWLADRKEPYNLGENEFHMAFRVDDYEAAYAHHKAMDAICFENTAMGIYFISDPDGYWIEILPQR